MAAPVKQGLNYYPRDVDLLIDDKFIRPKIEYGYLAIAVYDRLLEKVYKDKGYYLIYDDDTRLSVQWDISNTLNGRYPVDTATVGKVIETLVTCRLFSRDHYERGIITSRRIQSTYYRCTVERKSVEVLPEVWILSISEMESISKNSAILSFFVNRSDNEVNRSDNGINRSDNEQSKVNKSKEKVNKRESVGTPTLEAVQDYCKEIKSKVDAQRFYDYYAAIGWVVNGEPIKDWRAKLRNWEQSEKKETKQRVRQTGFVNYDQPVYSDEEFAEIMKRKAEK